MKALLLNHILKQSSKITYIKYSSKLIVGQNLTKSKLYSGQRRLLHGNKFERDHIDEKEAFRKKSEEHNKELNMKGNSKNEEAIVSLKKYTELKALYEDSEEHLEIARLKFDELRNAFIELQSDIDRIRKRSEIDIVNAKDFSITNFAKDTLKVYDDFNRALGALNPIESPETSLEEKLRIYNNFTEGIIMTKSTLLKVLSLHGVNEYNPINQKFDPNKHEAVFQTTSLEIDVGMISDVLQTGFYIGARILRPAKVGVVKKL